MTETWTAKEVREAVDLAVAQERQRCIDACIAGGFSKPIIHDLNNPDLDECESCNKFRNEVIHDCIYGIRHQDGEDSREIIERGVKAFWKVEKDRDAT